MDVINSAARHCLAATLAFALSSSSAVGQVPGGTLDPTTIPQFVTPLVIPPAMPETGRIGRLPVPFFIDYYEIAVSQFQQQVLPPGLPQTTVWSYESANHAGTLNYPAFTIEARYGRPVVVKWINNLKDGAGNYLPHLLPVDPTLHWANPPGGLAGRDSRPLFPTTPGPYTGPVPIISHLHGGHTAQESDGFPEAWYLPAARNIPAGYATEGSDYAHFQSRSPLGFLWGPGSATFAYDNFQDAATLWYHDHTLGMTRANVYAGPAGFYLLRGGARDLARGVLPGPAPAAGDPPGRRYYEIPIAIQDRSFNADGSLFYAPNREFFDGFPGPYLPGNGFASDVSPIWNPEFFGNTIVANGRTWPFLEVEARRYRFRFLNGSDSRFYILSTDLPGLRFWQIGADGGFLPAPVPLDQLLLGPAERADVIVDFSGVAPGTSVTLLNVGPDEPFGGGVPGVDFAAADPATTGRVMQFRVKARIGLDPSTPPARLVLPKLRPLGPATFTRQVSLNELDSALVCQDAASGAFVPCDAVALAAGAQLPFGPLMAQLGTFANGMPTPLPWMDAITENPQLGATEVWEIYNFTADAHPIHIHEVQFSVVNREPYLLDGTGAASPGGLVRPPEVWESGFKDTVVAYPGEITRLKALFDRAGKYVWHCHILSHEDNEMMRPLCVGPIANCPDPK